MALIIDPQTGGIAGNMIIGGLVDLGADPQEVKKVMESVACEFGRVEVSFEKVSKHGIASTYCHVEMLENKKPLHFPEFISKINKLDIPSDVKETSVRIFERIAAGESKVHGKTIEEIHFHEVGASDAVADVIGSVYAFYSLGLDKEQVIGLPIAVGGGRVETAHGTIPVPAPAVVEILKDAQCIGGPVDSELATPTGCAIYMELCDEIKEFLPQASPEKVGYGAGRKDFDFPNVLRIIKTKNIEKTDQIDVIETNIDHLTGEELGYLFDRLMSEGASDVSITPIIMKKNRQGSLLKVISKPEKRDHIVDLIFREVGTLGIRITPNIHRGIAKREIKSEKIEIDGKTYEIDFKIGYYNEEIISKRAEYEDIKRIAIETGMALKEVEKIVSDKYD